MRINWYFKYQYSGIRMTGPGSQSGAATLFKRRAREFRIIEAMLRLYCQAHHHTEKAALCADCAKLHVYAQRRLERCVFGEAKPTCANCTVHCYKANMREHIRVVMRWSGPRMLWRHPVLAIRHMIDGRIPAPVLQRSR
jgi:hypothetical protein